MDVFKYSVKLSMLRKSRYVFQSQLWSLRSKNYGEIINVLIDTGSFNTVVDAKLLPKYGILLKSTMRVGLGGTTINARFCLIHKIKVNGFVMENILALAFPFEGELRRHILLGANVLNNWDFNISRKRNELSFSEDIPTGTNAEYPYRTYFDNRGRNVYFQEI